MKLQLTKSVVTNPHLADYMVAIFDKMGWEEKSRVPLGVDEHNEPLMILTFSGRASDFKDDLFVVTLTTYASEKIKQDGGGNFYSIFAPTGIYKNSLAEYKDFHTKRRNQIIVVHSLNK